MRTVTAWPVPSCSLCSTMVNADQDKCTNQFCAMTGDNNLMGIAICISCVQHMGQHRLAGELMKDFGQLRTHARAFACCENNNVRFCHGLFTFTCLDINHRATVLSKPVLTQP